MRLIRNLCIGLILLGMTDSCLKEPEYYNTPSITFSDYYYGYSPATSKKNAVDSIVLSFNFKDGDGDIGLESADDSIPRYWENFYFYLENNQLIATSDKFKTGVQYINYQTKKNNPDFSVPDLTVISDNPPLVQLPDFISPYNCYNWEPKYVAGALVDTVYKQENPYNWNMFVDFYVEDSNNPGTFNKYDPLQFPQYQYPNCPIKYSFSGRIPILSSDLGKRSPLDGLIHYSIVFQSGGLESLFGLTHKLKLEFYIVDRALNKSNTILTDPFTLAQIRK